MATVVAGLVLVAVMQALTGSARLSHRASDRMEALVFARSILAGPPEAGSGTQAGLRWNRAVEQVEAAFGAELMRITVLVDGDDLGRPIQVSRLEVVAR